MKRGLIISILAVVVVQLVLAPASFPYDNGEKAAAQNKQTLNRDGEEITIIRDGFGVPHIFAKSARGAYYGSGYAVAQDRLYQMERFRRDGRGELAEIEGAEALPRDVQTRVLGYTESEFQAIFDSLKDDVKQGYEAYAGGVNAFIKEAVSQDRLPEAFKRVGLSEAAQWKVTDSIAIGVMMASRYGSVGGFEATNTRVLKDLKVKFGETEANKLFNDIYYLNDPTSPTTIAADDKVVKRRKKEHQVKSRLFVNDLPDESLDRVAYVAQQQAILDYARKHNLPTKWGSFCWVIGPRRSASGNPILVGNPQMGFSTPQIVHEIHLSTGELNVAGMGFAGIPGVIIGHNDYVAWSMTSGISDMVDLFAEKLNPENKGQYFYKGAYRDVEKRTEVFKIKGEKPARIIIARTIHGPLTDWDARPIDKSTIAYSYAAACAGHEFKTFEAIWGFNRAKTLDEFAKLAELIYTNHNFLAAAVNGDIGYWHCGRVPIRAPGHDPRLPISGTGEYDWLGFLPFSKMPQIINPKKGYLISWNNKPADWWDNGDFPVWGPVFHMPRIEQLIKPYSLMNFEQIRDIAQDIATHDTDAEALKPFLITALDKLDATHADKRILEAGNYLRTWNNHAVNGSVAKTIFDAWFHAVRDVIFDDEFSGLKTISFIYGVPHLFDQLIGASMLHRVLSGAKSSLPLSHDYLNGKGRDEAIIQGLIKALNELTSKRGPQMNLWTYNQGDINLKPLPGIPDTVRGTYIHAVELSTPLFRSESVLPPGQNENPLSPHYGDQREMAGYWRYKQLVYKCDQLEKALSPDK